MDERQNAIIGKAAVITFIVTYTYVLVECIYKYVSTWNIENCSWEVGLIILMPVCFQFFAREDKSLLLPKTLKDEDENLKNDKKVKVIRIKEYIKEAIIFSLGMLIIDFIVLLLGGIEHSMDFYFIDGMGKGLSYAIAGVNAFIGQFIISFIIFYFWNEHKVKKYNKMMKELE